MSRQGRHVPSPVVGYLLRSLRLSPLTCKAQCQEMLISSFFNQYLKVSGAVFDSFNKWVNSDFPLMAIRCALESKALASILALRLASTVPLGKSLNLSVLVCHTGDCPTDTVL